MNERETRHEAATPSPRPGVILDRDGTIIKDHGYVGTVDRVELLDGAAEAIAALNSAGIPVAVATNQAGVARGLYGIDDVRAVHAHLDDLLALQGAHVDAWLFCPYHPDGVVEEYARWSSDRKPAPGMALAAAHRLGLDLSRSWVVGDSDCDVELAPRSGRAADPDRRRSATGRQVTTVPTSPPPCRTSWREHASREGRDGSGARTFPQMRYESAVPVRRALLR